MNPMETVVVDRHGLDDLIRVLRDDGRCVVGPTVRESAVVLGDLESGADLPDGWGVRTAPGEYRLERRGDGAVFSHSAGPMSWKTFVHPAKQVLWSERGGTFSAPEPADRRFAFVGVRGCDLAAIRTLGTVLGADPGSVTARVLADLVIVAVNCIERGGVCFCASMGTGPDVGGGYDLALTERIDEAGHRFVVDVGTATRVTVVAGELDGRRPPAPPPDSWASRPESDLAIWVVSMEAGGEWDLPPAEGPDTVRVLYVFEGDGLRIDDEHVGGSTGAVLRADRPLHLSAAGGGPTEALLLQGRPIGEPVAQYGPFVMNDRAGIEQAFEDYRRTGFGGWPWPTDDPDHGPERGRFARNVDGRVEEPAG